MGKLHSYPATHACCRHKNWVGHIIVGREGDFTDRDVQNGASHAGRSNARAQVFAELSPLLCPRYLSSGVFEMKDPALAPLPYLMRFLLIGIVGGRFAFSAELRQRFVLQMLNGVDAVFCNADQHV